MAGFLLLDDAADEATRRLREFGQQQLQGLQQVGQGLTQLNQPLAQQPAVQDVTQRLQDFGQARLLDLQQQAQQAQQQTQDVTQRLQTFGEQQLQNLQTTVAQPFQQGPAIERGGDLRAYARQAAQKAGIDPDIFVAQIQQESGFNPSARSPAGAQGIAQIMPQTAAGWGVDVTDPYASLDAAAQNMARYQQQYGGIENALRAYNAGPGNIDASRGFEETNRYVKNILGAAGRTGVGQAVQGALGTISQFGDKQLTAAEAYAACGPAAAVRFAQLYGRNPTLREATDLARSVGWSEGQGMAGLQSESALFDKLGIPHRMVGPDWQALAAEASSGNPVTISTPGHYFTADNYDRNTGAFHVGSSGTDLRQGSEWMTPSQMETVMGPLQGGMAADNPQVPAPSPLSEGAAAVGGAIGQGLEAAVRPGLQLLGGLVDEAGNAIRHNAYVIFPESLDKIRNAFSGTQGGQIRPEYATGLAAAAAAGGAAYMGVNQPGSNVIGDTLGDLGRRASEALGIDERQRQIEANRPTGMGPTEALGTAARLQALEATGAVRANPADQVVDAAKQQGWTPSPEDEASARRVLQQMNLGNVAMTLSTMGTEGPLALLLARGAASMGGAAVGGEAGRRGVQALGGDETAQSVGELAGSLIGGVGAPAAVGRLARTPAGARFLAEEAGTLTVGRGGGGIERPFNYDPGTPEWKFEQAAAASRAKSPDGLAHLDLNNLPKDVLPFDVQSKGTRIMGLNAGKMPTLDDLRHLRDTSLNQRDFYFDQANEAADLVGNNVDEWLSVNSINSSQTPLARQVAESIETMGVVRQAERDAIANGQDVEQAVIKAIHDDTQLHLTSYTHPQKRGFLEQGYRTGVSEVKGAPKTSSFQGNYDSAMRGVHDPRVTNDTWDWQIMNLSDALSPGVGAGKIAELTAAFEKSGKQQAALEKALAKPANTAKQIAERDAAIARAQAMGPSIPMVRKAFNNAANDDTAYRGVEAVFNELGAELGMDGYQAQSALWSAIRHLFSDPQLEAMWKAGKFRQAVDLGAERGVFAQKLEGEIATVMDDPLVQAALAKWGHLLKEPPPLKGQGMQRSYAGLSPTKPAARPARPSHAAFRAEQAGIREAGAPLVTGLDRTAVDALGVGNDGRFPWFTNTHRVTEVAPGQYAVHLPSGNSDTAQWLAAQIGRATGRASVGVHVPDVNEAAAIGHALVADPETIGRFAGALTDAGIPHVRGPSGRSIQIPFETADDQTTAQRIINAAQTSGVDLAALRPYQGVIDAVPESSYESLSRELGGQFGPTTRGRSGLLERGVGGVPGGAEPARISPLYAARLGTTAAGAGLGYVTTPEEASPQERIARTAAGGLAGLAAGNLATAPFANSLLEQSTLQSLRRAGISAAPPARRAPATAVGVATDLTKQGLLTNPLTHAANAVGNVIELLRQPAALAAGGRFDEAAAGTNAMARAMPEALNNAWSVLRRGQQAGTLGTEAQQMGRSQQVFRLLGAMDIFTRTLGEYQGMASRGLAMLREAGLEPGTAAADSYLAAHAAELYNAGARAGASGVFGAERVAGGRGTLPLLDHWMSNFSKEKDRLLASGNKAEQALGALLDTQLPFSGVPTRILQVGIGRLPIVSQATGVGKALRAAAKGDTFGAQKALGETALESLVQLKIAQEIANGNITGSDDPEHPSSVNLGGTWVPLRQLGGYGLPMSLMAAFAEGWDKQGNKIQDPNVARALLDRFGAGLNATGKPLWDAVPGSGFVDLLSGIGEGGVTRAGEKSAQNLLNRVLAPSVVKTIEDATDPVARDIARRGPESLWEQPLSRWPGLARFLPEKIDPVTGQVQPRQRQFGVPGIVAGLSGEEQPKSLVRSEIGRLNAKDYGLNEMKTYPESVSYQGMTIPLTPDEQRKVTAITGRMVGDLEQRLQSKEYQSMTDDEKARFIQAYQSAWARARVAALRDVIGQQALVDRLQRGQRVVGRLTDEARQLQEASR